MTDERRSPDVLDPGPTVAGFDEVRRAVKSARRLFWSRMPLRSPPSASRSAMPPGSFPISSRAPGLSS